MALMGLGPSFWSSDHAISSGTAFDKKQDMIMITLSPFASAGKNGQKMLVCIQKNPIVNYDGQKEQYLTRLVE